MIDFHGDIKVIDFGYSRELIKQKSYTLCGTPSYMSPELISNEGYSFEADFWAYGVLLY